MSEVATDRAASGPGRGSNEKRTGPLWRLGPRVTGGEARASGLVVRHRASTSSSRRDMQRVMNRPFSDLLAIAGSSVGGRVLQLGHDVDDHTFLDA